jgi:hypothetical protein
MVASLPVFTEVWTLFRPVRDGVKIAQRLVVVQFEEYSNRDGQERQDKNRLIAFS